MAIEELGVLGRFHRDLGEEASVVGQLRSRAISSKRSARTARERRRARRVRAPLRLIAGPASVTG
jgi:hypothetical protein